MHSCVHLRRMSPVCVRGNWLGCIECEKKALRTQLQGVLSACMCVCSVYFRPYWPTQGGVSLVQPRPMLPLWVTDDPGNPQQVRRYFVDTSIYRPTITPPTCSSGVEPRGSATAVATPYDKQVSSCGTFNSTFVVYTSVGAASWLTLMASVMREQHATETEVCVRF